MNDKVSIQRTRKMVNRDITKSQFLTILKRAVFPKKPLDSTSSESLESYRSDDCNETHIHLDRTANT